VCAIQIGSCLALLSTVLTTELDLSVCNQLMFCRKEDLPVLFRKSISVTFFEISHEGSFVIWRHFIMANMRYSDKEMLLHVFLIPASVILVPLEGHLAINCSDAQKRNV